MIHYDNNGTLASFESQEAMLAYFPNGLTQVTDLSDYINPPLTYDIESKALNVTFDLDMKTFTDQYSTAMARNGGTQSDKVTAAQQKITDLDTWYNTESDALIIKYFS